MRGMRVICRATMEFEKNTLLFGADPTPRIVAIELGETGTVRVYRREADRSTVAEVEPFQLASSKKTDSAAIGSPEGIRRSFCSR